MVGVIKEEGGEVSGLIPDNEAFAVHYPGYPSSMSRAIQTLGGLSSITNARISHSVSYNTNNNTHPNSNRLEVYFRPEDPYSHPVSAQLRPCNHLLLKISASASTSPPDNEINNGSSSVHSHQQPAEQKVQLHAGIVARIREAYVFEGMADYQHVVAVHAAAAGSSKKRAWNQMEQPHFDKTAGLLGLDDEGVMIFLPPRFAPKDFPESLVLRPPPISACSKKKPDESVPSQYEIHTEPGLAIDFNVKEIPKISNWKDHMPKDSDLWNWQMAVSELFEERPIWPKDSLVERLLEKNLAFNHQMLKRLLLAVAYYFSGGPFLRLWIKKGYDPRKDPDSRIYQRVDFRVQPESRSFCDRNAGNNLKHAWEDLCKFKVFPYKCHTSLQLYELDDNYIQEEIRKPAKKTTCSYETGWFSRHRHESFICRVKMRFLSVYPEAGAQKLLKAASDAFQKSLRACTLEDAGKPYKDEGRQNDTEFTMDDRDDGDQNDVDGVEMDEIEADDDEEEMEAYEDLGLGGEDGEISLQQSHLLADAENSSRSYLQEFFYMMTGTMGDDDVARDNSDGEYQIYEPDDDDDDDDEE